MKNKRRAILMAGIFFCLNLTLFSQTISLNLNGVSVKKAIAELQEKSGYSFVYAAGDLDTEKTVNVQANQLKDAVEQILKGQHVSYEIKDENIIVKSINSPTSSMKIQIAGVVNDVNGEPVIGANIFEKGNTSNGVITDLDGNFAMTVSADAILVISYIGYDQKEIRVNNNTRFTIVLEEDTKLIDEVVVIGYGSVKRSNLTSSVSKITTEAIKDRPVTTLSEAFQGQLAGVQAQAADGGIPGQEMTIRIRGVNTVNGDSSPLYVIDGVPRENMSGINPNDIASIQILKDASATSIYGSRGANGVVLIETKQGTGKPTVTFDAYFGLQTPETKLDLMDGNEWITYNVWHRNVDHLRTGGSMSDSQADRPQGFRIPDWWYTTNNFTNWQNEVLRNAPIQSYMASASGQNDLGQIYFSLGYTDQKGIIRHTDYDRYNLRVNSSLNLMKNMRVGTNISVSIANQQSAGVNLGDRQGKDAALHHALMMSPLVEPGICVQSVSPGGTVSAYDYGASWIDPLAQLAKTTDDTNTTRVQAAVWGEWDIIPGLTYKIQYSNNYDGTTYEYFQPADVNDSNTSTGNSSSTRTNNWIVQNTLTWDRQIKDHHINVLLGQSAEKQKYYIGYMEATGWPYENITTLNVASSAVQATTEHVNYVNASFFGRVSYDYKEKYLFTASIRRDGSSRFGMDSKWGTFPSVSVGWKINEESFMKDISEINLLKIRGSFGTSGNDRIGDYQYTALLGTYNAAYGNKLQPGVAASNISNSELKWEQTRTYDIGLDFSAFHNRIQFNFDYYINETTDLLFDMPVPYTTGFNSYLANIGKIRNQGWEIDVTSHNMKGKFQWDTSLNLSRNRNKVLDLGNVGSFTTTLNDAMFITEVGGPVSQFYVLRTDGFLTANDFDANGKALVPIADGQEEGNYKFVDQNNDGIINSADYVAYGNNLPDLTWGLTNRFSYKNFDLSILLQGQFGGNVLYLGQRHNDSGMADRTLYSRWVRCYKTAEQMAALPTDYIEKHGIDVSWDGETPNPFGNNLNNADHRIYDATYVRIKNINLSYTFPRNLLVKTKISDLKIYVSVDNVYTFSNYPGYTPETSSYGNGTTALGVDYSTYPLSRKYTIGLSLSF